MPRRVIDQAVYDSIARVYPRLKARELMVGKKITGQALFQWVRDNLPKGSIGQERLYHFKKELDEKYPAFQYDWSKDPEEKPLIAWSAGFDWDNPENTLILLELVATRASRRLAKWVLRMKPILGWVGLIPETYDRATFPVVTNDGTFPKLERWWGSMIVKKLDPTMLLARKYHTREWMSLYLNGAEWDHTIDLDAFLVWQAWKSKDDYLKALEDVKSYYSGMKDQHQELIRVRKEYDQMISLIHGSLEQLELQYGSEAKEKLARIPPKWRSPCHEEVIATAESNQRDGWQPYKILNSELRPIARSIEPPPLMTDRGKPCDRG